MLKGQASLSEPVVPAHCEVVYNLRCDMSASVTNVTVADSPAPPVSDNVAETVHETIIEPTTGWIGLNWRELIASRELLYFLIWRDLKVRYKQAILGVGWVVVQPVLNMILFTVIFGSAAGLNSRLKGHESQYSVFVFVALLPWQLFATALNSGGMSLVNQQNMLKKIYFPRLYVPTAAVGGAMVDLFIAFVIVLILAVFKGLTFTPLIFWLPALLLLTLMHALGAAYLLSALTVRYRDFRFLIPFISQVLMYVSFVAFPPSLVGNTKWKWLLLFNPMYGVVASWRKCLLGFPDALSGFDVRYLASAIIGGALLLLVGVYVFRRTERNFVDIA